MSMQTSAEIRYGLLVHLSEIQAYCEKEDCLPWDLEERQLGINYIGDPIGAYSHLVTREGVDTYEHIKDSCFVVMELSKYPRLFETAYSSYEEAIVELKERYKEYLPEDYDYEANFKVIYYAVFG